MTDPLALLWGKTDAPRGGTATAWHPLLWHLLDTCAVAERLWDGYVSPLFRQSFADALGLDDPDQARAWFLVFAASHDYGKASPHFQQQQRDWKERQRAAGLSVSDTWYSHEEIGLCFAATAFERDGMAHCAAMDWARVTNLEHGRFLGSDRRRSVEDMLAEGHKDWLPVAAVLHEEVKAACGVTTRLDTATRLPSGPLASTVAGLVKIADWMASTADRKRTYFSFAPYAADHRTYLDTARRQAQEAVRDAALIPWLLPDPDLGWDGLFGGLVGAHPPRPAQQAVHDIAAAQPLASITVIEDEMGQGKTESALWVAHDKMLKGATGIYVALPTTATAAQMHLRVSRWMRTPGVDGPVPTLNTGDWMARQGTPISDGGQDGRESGLTLATEASEWLRGAHRPLLSRVGVGTVDQVLLAAQPVRFGVARLTGLAGRVVIFDEVHAYDSFMSTLLERALQWLAGLGCPVVILSATLPDSTRVRLVNAYRSGLVGDDVEDTIPAVGYPCITTGDADGATTIRLPSPAPSRQTRLEHLEVDADDPESSLARHLRDAVPDGATGRAAIICNSVAHAQHTYDEVRRLFPDATVTLLHSRFTRRDRAEIEADLLAVFGKNPQVPRQQGLRIVVGTQVLEQSLDVDFDYLVTEAAPVDLLLQRLGRVHRHDNARPAWAAEPTVVIAWPPPNADGSPDFPVTSYVYQATVAAVLLRTFEVLRHQETLTRPGDISLLVQQVYDGSPGGLDADLRQAWDRAREQQDSYTSNLTSAAEALTLHQPWRRRSAFLTTVPGGEAEEAPPLDDPRLGRHFRYRSRYDTEARTVALYDPTRPQPPLSDIRAWFGLTTSISARTLEGLEVDQPSQWRGTGLRHIQRLTLGGRASYNRQVGLVVEREPDGW